MPIQNDQRVFFLLLSHNHGPIAICGIQRVGMGFELLTIGFYMARAQITRLILSFATTVFFYFFCVAMMVDMCAFGFGKVPALFKRMSLNVTCSDDGDIVLRILVKLLITLWW